MRAQHFGIVLSLLEAVLFGFVAALHFGATLTIGDATFAAPFLYPAGIVEAVLALALFVAVVLPGGGRPGRVMAAQILAVIALFTVHVALLRMGGFDARNEIFYGVALVLALASIALVASPALRGRTLAR